MIGNKLLFGILLMGPIGCGDIGGDLANKLTDVTSPQSQKFLGCPAGTFAYDGWSGEYPLPIVQVNKTITVDALTNICEKKPP